MLTAPQIQLMRYRKSLAINSLKILKEIKTVKSTNYFFDFTTDLQGQILDANRATVNYNTMSGPLTATLTHGVGNCDEKARLCWAGIRNKPGLLPTHQCMLCAGVDYDHVFVVIADVVIAPGVNTTLGALGVTAIVIDGWTEDWYFPNIPTWDLINNIEFLNTPNPRQTIVRSRTRAAQIENYESGGVINNT